MRSVSECTCVRVSTKEESQRKEGRKGREEGRAQRARRAKKIQEKVFFDCAALHCHKSKYPCALDRQSKEVSVSVFFPSQPLTRCMYSLGVARTLIEAVRNKKIFLIEVRGREEGESMMS